MAFDLDEWKLPEAEGDSKQVVEYATSENDYFNYNANAGFPLWLDKDTLEFLFSIRYSSPAFTGTYLQEDYRRATHREFSSLLKDLIRQKIEAMRAMPSIYESMQKKNRVFDENLIDSSNVLEIANSLGIDASQIDVYTVVGDVAESLQKMLNGLIKERPGMNSAEKNSAMLFVDGQLWDDDAKQRWRAVSAGELADLFDYNSLPQSLKIMQALDEYVQREFQSGSMQAMDLKNAPVDALLCDAVIEDVREALKANSESECPEDEQWVIQDAIAGSDDSWS